MGFEGAGLVLKAGCRSKHVSRKREQRNKRSCATPRSVPNLWGKGLIARGDRAPAKHAHSVRADAVPLSYDTVSDEQIAVVAMSLLRLLTGTGNQSARLRKLWRDVTRYAGAFGSADTPPAASVNAKSMTGNRCAGAF
jgi:hypothetical protein